MEMKFRGHETFFIRKGWLGKGLKAVKNTGGEVFLNNTDTNPMDELGMGANMVKSLRYWMQVVGLTQEPASSKRIQSLTRLGETINRCDPYIEEIGTLLLLQQQLCSNAAQATAWYVFFNVFNMSEFNKGKVIDAFKNYILKQAGPANMVAERSLEDDFTCILGTYIGRSLSRRELDPESNIDCPLGELGLLGLAGADKKSYRKMAAASQLFNAELIMACISRFIELQREKDLRGTEKGIRLEDLLNGPGSPGRVFNLDVISLLEILELAQMADYLHINRTAGLDEVNIKQDMTYIEWVNKYYGRLG